MENVYALNLAEDGRVLSVTYSEYAPEAAPRVTELPEEDLYEYIFKDGVFIHDPIPKEEIPEGRSMEEQIKELQEALDLLLSGAMK